MGKVLAFFKTKTCRLGFMLVLTTTFFLVELIVGHVSHSLSLIGDSYHMLSDIVALIIGILSVYISTLRSQKNTYGWARAEVVGALTNSVFLIALCFTIFVESIERFLEVQKIDHPFLLLYVGIIGLVINLIGLFMLYGHAHGHSHGGNGGGHGHSHHNKSKNEVFVSDQDNYTIPIVNAVDGNVKKAANSIENSGNCSNSFIPSGEDKIRHSDDFEKEGVDIDAIRGKTKLKSSEQLNMRAVFLHVLGDALGSVIVVISALLIIYIDSEWKYYFDPAMSMILVIILLSTTLPLLKESAYILLQTVPTHIQVADLKDKLVNKVEGVLAVHEFHVWQLAGNRIIASAHIRCHGMRDYMRIAEEVKSFFHNEGIHSTTIQPEFDPEESSGGDDDCILECGPEKTCHVDTCCARSIKSFVAPGSFPGMTANNELRQRIAIDPTLNLSAETNLKAGKSQSLDAGNIKINVNKYNENNNDNNEGGNLLELHSEKLLLKVRDLQPTSSLPHDIV